MAKYLLIAAVVISLATAGLGYKNYSTLTATKADLASTEGTLRTTQKNLETSKKDLAAAKTAAEAATTDKEKAAAELAATSSQLSTAKSSLEAAEAATKEKETQIAALQSEIDGLKATIAAGNGNGDTTAGPAGPSAREQELEALVASLQEKLKANEGQLADLRTKEEDRRKNQMRQGLEGRVLAVNSAWNFVVLSIGDKQGAVNNAELLLKRGGQYLGKVRITSVEPSTSIADIVANTLPPGVAVQPGDSVIFQSSAN
jgi:hypothetical protein